jgi:beta-mannanase
MLPLSSIPHITWEPWTGGTPYALDVIINGRWDSYIAGYANQAKFWSKPLFIRVGHEMNGDWYPWGGKNNGGSIVNGFGDSTKPDGPERFISAFRHIRHVFDSVGVANVSWIWSPNNFSSTSDTWNSPESYYPGDDVVDWIGFDGIADKLL